MRIKANKKQKLRQKAHPDPYDPYEEFLGKKVEVRSQYENEWVLDKDSLDAFFKQMEQGIGKFPNGFRHYESFANYKLVNPDAEIQDYISEVNRQVEFDEFMAIMR